MIRNYLKLLPLLTAVTLFNSSYLNPAYASEEHADHGEQEGHEHHDEEALKLSPQQLKDFSIQLSQAGPGVIRKTLDLTGEVIVEPDRLYHVVPRVAGVVQKVYKQLGDEVKAGELLAQLSSRELANAKAEFVATDSLLKLANSNLQRDRQLYRGKITSRRQYQAAKQAQIEAAIRQKAAKQRLQALGLSLEEIDKLIKDQDKDLTLYALKAPADGVIIAKHASHGELLDTTTRSFTIADLSRVWVNLTLYQKDLNLVKTNQKVFINNRFSKQSDVTAQSHISWISPVLDIKTRSGIARVILDNSQNLWRPGAFISARVVLSETPAKIVIPLTALQNIDGKHVVFVQHEDGDFEPQEIITGKRDFNQVEILSGLKPGQTYVSRNAFTLKAQAQKGAFGHGHSH
ncbi:efflux RND transporter periplasmic adaptor subunit [methane-oxidizing endosymbiont of Gigantopelta aegis]|uniref:efflux RND transporter periplasmic adaptor subunit n=1 Tax=methane-oxidizing endosymbiont of Gigantopelta aegis TaxID=2794938 RepID=UPI0018DBE42E|nr:efflux RND transporter periplasmic adaptor subunit [methane-oxidizing endosymbiont of Gigantopelta aegis]